MQVHVNGFAVEVPAGTSARSAAQAAGFSIPQLCNPSSDSAKRGQCGLCLIRVNGRDTLACHTGLKEGDTLETTHQGTLRVRAATASALAYEHFATNGNQCVRRDGSMCPGVTKHHGTPCPFLRLPSLAVVPTPQEREPDYRAISVERGACTACGRCVDVCGPGAVSLGYRTGGTPRPRIDGSACISCGQCVKVCPTGTLSITNRMGELLGLVTNPALARWYQYAPAVLPALAVHYSLKPQEATHELMYAILARMGSYRTISTLVGADIITVVEGTELLERVADTWHLPLVTSCCPGHMNLWQQEVLKILGETGIDISLHMSTCHSPQEAVGALMRHVATGDEEHQRKRHVRISIMPCTAKQGEADRYGNEHVDYVITTVELLALIDYLGIDVVELARMQARGALPALTEYPFAIPNTGGAALFAQTGGVTLAVLRYLGHTILGRALGPADERTIERENLDTHSTLLALRLGQVVLKALVVRGAPAARKAYRMIADGSAKKRGIQVIEVMACPQGCITGGGQPRERGLGVVYKLVTLQCQDRAADDSDPAAFRPIQDLLGGLGEQHCHELFHRH